MSGSCRYPHLNLVNTFCRLLQLTLVLINAHGHVMLEARTCGNPDCRGSHTICAFGHENVFITMVAVLESENLLARACIP